MTYFESLDADLPLRDFTAPEWDALGDRLYEIINNNPTEAQAERAFNDLRTFAKAIGEVAWRRYE